MGPNDLSLPWPYTKVYQINCVKGHIAWRWGTGGNMEILHLQAYKVRQGAGRCLLQMTLRLLLLDPPYESVYGFTRTDNLIAQSFYESMGFDLSLVRGVYRDGSAVLFSQRYEKLKELHHIER